MKYMDISGIPATWARFSNKIHEQEEIKEGNR